MQILQVAKYYPIPANTGGKIRVLGLATALSNFSEVDLLCFGIPQKSFSELILNNRPYREIRLIKRNTMLSGYDSVIINSLFSDIPFRSSLYVTSDFILEFKKLLDKHQYNLIQVEELPMMAFLLRHFQHINVPIIYSAHNVESILSYTIFKKGNFLKRILANIERKRTEKEEKKSLCYSKMVLLVSELDDRQLEKLFPIDTTKHLVVPNCPSNEIVRHSPVNTQEILFPACFGWQPNIDATSWFIQDILNNVRLLLPNIAVRFVGSNMQSSLEMRLKKLGCLVDKDVPTMNSYYESARTVFIPLRMGSGTRIKIIEAWTAGVPVVSTTIGAEGLDAKHGIDILLADKPSNFADSLFRLVTDDGLYHRLRNAGLKRSKTYKWENFSDILYSSFSELNKTAK